MLTRMMQNDLNVNHRKKKKIHLSSPCIAFKTAFCFAHSLFWDGGYDITTADHRRFAFLFGFIPFIFLQLSRTVFQLLFLIVKYFGVFTRVGRAKSSLAMA